MTNATMIHLLCGLAGVLVGVVLSLLTYALFSRIHARHDDECDCPECRE